MTPRVLLAPLAATEFAEAASFYDQAREGLGNAFRAEVDRALKRVVRFPQSGQTLRGELRRVVLPRFPFLIVYRVAGNEVQVLGILATRSNPRQPGGAGGLVRAVAAVGNGFLFACQPRGESTVRAMPSGPKCERSKSAHRPALRRVGSRLSCAVRMGSRVRDVCASLLHFRCRLLP